MGDRDNGLRGVGSEPEPPEVEQAFADANATQTVLADVAGERMRQRAKWGNDHDDRHDTNDWNRIHYEQLVKASGELGQKRRRYLVHLAATLVAEVEAMDRAEARADAERRSAPPSDYSHDISDIPF